MKQLSIIAAVVSALWASPCSAANVAIDRRDFGDEWPFTTPRGILGCTVVGKLSTGAPIGAVTFTADGKVYAVNGIARGHAKSNGWHDLKEVWRDNPKARGLKVSAGVIIERGLLLCEAPAP